MLNYVDVLLLLMIVGGAIAGAKRGFILGMFDLLRWVGCLVAGLRFYPAMASLLGTFISLEDTFLLPISFFIVVLLTGILLSFLESLLLDKLHPDTHVRTLNRVMGLLPGALNGTITVAIVAVLLLAFPLPDGLEMRVQQSSVANRFAAYAYRAEVELKPVFEGAVQRSLNNLTISPESGATVELPYTIERAEPQPKLEARMLELINQERKTHGLRPLQPDTALRTVARQHSADMFRRGYFSHYSPEGDDAAERIREAGIRFWVSGENLALAPSLSIAHQGLMNSPGHRANILQERYGRVGIGVLKGGPGKLMITQNFRN
ncbi:CvpA family protein [Pontibacter cellulosilyticus]|uniref:CvpA family protein n=1 Tax=Pontibacter cellulosilyticus TaxID=1720253 RepID=A0A923N2V8_9BACT|nr:CvpA family protein [Pontibacter cellulosilyticus]MBC5991423.1 CvpA family protein [Pontibacter cellulosilyticus]